MQFPRASEVEQIRSILHAFAQGIRSPPSETIAEWADANRVLSGEEAEGGQWRTSRTPYAREIMERLSPSDPCMEVVFWKASQIGGSEILNNAVAYWMDRSPGRILLVQPTVEAARDYSTQRIAPMIALCPTLREKVEDALDPKTRKNNIQLKNFPGGSLKISGANSAAQLKSKPIVYLAADEIDEWDQDVDGQGDPLDLAIARMGTFGYRRKIFKNSSPTLESTSRIKKAYLEGDQREYFVVCQHCDGEHKLEWANIYIPKEADGVTTVHFNNPRVLGMPEDLETGTDAVESEVYHECPLCGAHQKDHEKTAMMALENGARWKPQAPYNGRTRSYRINGLYSPVGWLSWSEVVYKFLKSYKDPKRFIVFVNTVLGETWKQESGETIDEHEVEARAYEFPERISDDIATITLGADISGASIEYEIIGWTPDYQSYSLAYGSIPGDTSGMRVYNEGLNNVLKRTFKNESGDTLRIWGAGIDASYEGTNVGTFAKARLRDNVFALKGSTDPFSDMWPDAWSQSKKAKINFRYKRVGITLAKRHIYTRLAKRKPGFGFCHFPDDRPSEYYEQLTSERIIPAMHRGRACIRFVKTQDWARNEPLDVRVYGYCVLVGLVQSGLDLEGTLDRRARRRDNKKPGRARVNAPKPAPFIPVREGW